MGKTLTEELRSFNRSILRDDEAAVRLVAKERLTEPEDDERIEPAANYRQDKRADDGAAHFREEVFHS